MKKKKKVYIIYIYINRTVFVVKQENKLFRNSCICRTEQPVPKTSIVQQNNIKKTKTKKTKPLAGLCIAGATCAKFKFKINKTAETGGRKKEGQVPVSRSRSSQAYEDNSTVHQKAQRYQSEKKTPSRLTAGLHCCCLATNPTQPNTTQHNRVAYNISRLVVLVQGLVEPGNYTET